MIITPEIEAHFSASSARGQILNVIATLETNLDIFLSQHFCGKGNKQEQMLELVSPRMTFDNKRQILKFLIDNYYTNWGKKYQNFNVDLKEIYDERNVFAHYTMDITKDGIEYATKNNLVCLIKFKNTRTRVEYNEAKINNIMNKIIKYSDAIAELINLN